MVKKMKWFDWAAFALLVVGGLNWGLVGVFNFNLVEALFGNGGLTTFVYGLVGLSGLYGVYTVYKLASKGRK